MDISQRITDFKKAEMERLRSGAEVEPEEAPEPVDVYQRDRVRIRDVNTKSFPKGSSAIVTMAANSVVDGAGAEGLARAFKRAKDDSESLKARGEQGRAELRRRQYMQEYFLPAVEIVVNSASPDELLSNDRALKELDKYVLLEGSGKGYTAAYVRQAYGNQLGQAKSKDDNFVRGSIQRLNMLLDNGEVRAALGLANKIKDRVDKGEAMADDASYDLVARIAAYCR